jgi:hypothetical protein
MSRKTVLIGVVGIVIGRKSYRFVVALLLALLAVGGSVGAPLPAMAQAGGAYAAPAPSLETLAQPGGQAGATIETPTVTKTVGGGGDYATLKAAFDAINAGTLTGAVQLNVIGDTTETATAVLNASGSGSASYTSVLIVPVGVRTISGNLQDQTLLALNGADNVTIDGLNNGADALTLSNTAISLFAGTATLRFYGDATNNTVTNATILGSATSSPTLSGGTVWFSFIATTAGNNNNVISNCNIGPAGANLPNHAIYVDGGNSGDNNLITDNRIYDYFHDSRTSRGIYLTGQNTGWTISGNRFYQTAPRTQIGGAIHAAIEVASSSGGGDGHTITSNIIGYASAAGTGTYSLTFPAAGPGRFYGIYYSLAGTGATTTIQGNTITAITINTASAAGFSGIRIEGSLVPQEFNISSNVIGSLTMPGAITYNSSSTGAADLYGIINPAPRSITMQSNNVGGITASNSSGGAIKLTGLYAGSSANETNTMVFNTVGSTAAPITINAGASGSQTIGLHCKTGRCFVSNNQISNLTTNSANTSVGVTASLIGMLVDGPTSLQPSFVGDNQIHSLSNSHPSAAVVVTGLRHYDGPNTTVAGNFLYGLSTLSTSASAAINGIEVDGLLTSGARSIFINNMIALGSGMTANSPRIHGFSENFGGTGNDFHFNSIYIGGSGVASGSANSFAFFSSVVNTTRSYRNNIFVNARSNGAATGKHYAISLGGATVNPTGLTSNNNVLFASGMGGVTGLFNGVDRATLANWQAATGQDADSFAADPQYLAPAASTPDLHINPAVLTLVEGNGFPSGLATSDFDGETRSTLTPVDIGADAGNFVGIDLVRPSIVYTPLANTDSTGNRAFGGVAITDNSGVNTAAGSKPRVYYKRSTDGNVWNDNTPGTDGWKYAEANGASSPFDFTLDYARLNGGTGVSLGTTVQYFVVAQDLAPTPNVGINSGVFASAPSSVALTAAAFPLGGAINSYQVIQSFSGVYSVPGSYPSLTNPGGIFQALNAGLLTGNIVIEITADLTGETGQVALNQLLESPAGSNFTVTIKPSGAPRTITGTGTGSTIIRLNGADRIIIDGSLNGGSDRSLTISNPSTGSHTVFTVTSLGGGGQGALSNTIKNCIINGGTVGNSSLTTWGIYVAGVSAQQGPGNNRLTIQNNHIRRVKIGIQAFGSPTLGPNDRLQIVGNTLGDDVAADSIGSLGLFVGFATNSTFSQNVVKNVSNSYGSPYGMRFFDGVRGNVMRNNITGIRHTGAGGFGGVGIELTTQGGPITTILANNFISDIGGDGSSNALVNGIAGIRILGDTLGVSLYYNSVNLGSGSFAGNVNGTQSAALAITNSTFGLDIRNNIFATNLVNTNAPGAKTYAILTSASSGGIFGAINHNDYYATGAQAVLGRLNNIDRATLADWQTASGQDANSIAANPLFISPTDLHIDPNALRLISPVDSAGTPIAGITDDFDGGPRNPITPDIGGDEIGSALAVTLADFNTAQVGDRVQVTWETVSEIDNAGFNLYRGLQADGSDRLLLTYVASQAPGSTQGAAYSYQDAAVEAGQTYWYWLEDVDLSGATTLHGPVSATVQAPTAVTLSSVSASPAAAAPALTWLLLAAGAGLALGAARLRRRD